MPLSAHDFLRLSVEAALSAHGVVNNTAIDKSEEFIMSIAFMLCKILRATGITEDDETNKRVQEALFALGLTSNPIPQYLRHKEPQPQRG